jgi:hypothetical protein
MMAGPTVADGSSVRRGRWQLSLADLSFFVLAAGLGVSIIRGARGVWGMRARGTIMATPVPFARTVGVAVAVAAVWLVMILARQMIGLLRRRGRPGAAATRNRLPASMAWRAAALGLLLAFAMQESWILRVDDAAFAARSSSQVNWNLWYEVRETLTPVCAVLAMIGLALGTGAGLAFGRSDRRRRRPYWLFVPLAALVAVLFMGLPNGWWSLITQLILIALEAVNNAMPPPHRAPRDGLSVRLLRAGIETVPAALACLWLALVVARDFERTRRAEPWATTRGGWLLRILSLATALAAGAIVALVAIPTVSPRWLDGFRQILEPEIIAMVLAGFGVFAAGLAARTLVPPASDGGPRWRARLSAVAVPLVLLTIVLVSALRYLPSSTQLDPTVPALVGRICDLAREVPVWLESMVPDSGELDFAAWLDPERLAWMLAVTAVALLVLELAISGPAQDRPAPFDAVAESRGRLARFLWLTAALTAVCLVALPTLTVLGQAIVHIRFRIDNWMADGWPSPF